MILGLSNFWHNEPADLAEYISEPNENIINMKTQFNSHMKAHPLRGAFYLLIVAICATPFALAQRSTTKQSVANLGNVLPGATCSPAPTPYDSFWVEHTPLPYQAAGVFAVSDGIHVYAGGGTSGDLLTLYDDLWQYTPGSNSWIPLRHSPDAHALSQAVYFNGKIYDIGGWISDSVTTDVTRIYDIGTNTWSPGAPMPAPLGSMAIALWDGKIYVAGGYEAGIGVVNTLYAYDIVSNTWDTTLPSMPQAMNYPGFGVIDGKLYIAGGTTPCCFLNTLYIYDIANHTWTSGANLPLGIRGSGCAVLDGKLYLYGGQTPMIMTNVTLIYDPCDNSWSNGPNMNVERGFFYGAALNDNSIVAPGGLDFSLTGLDDNEQLINLSRPTPTPRPRPKPRPRP